MIEYRSVRGLEIRDTTDDGRPDICGYAAVFDSPSVDLGDFREVVRPNAFGDLDGRDIRALVNHDPALVIGRSSNEVDTLLIRKDTIGLAVKIRPPDNSAGRDIVESIKRKDIDGMSFGFRTLDDNWWTDRDGTPMRALNKVDLIEVSVCSFPAYPATQVGLRNRDYRDTIAVMRRRLEQVKGKAGPRATKTMRRRLELRKLAA